MAKKKNVRKEIRGESSSNVLLKEDTVIDSFAKDLLVCPFCGWEHDPVDMGLGRKSYGYVRCHECGETFSFETTQKIVYTTKQE